MSDLALESAARDLGASMASPHHIPEAVRAYCSQNNYSEPVLQDGQWWAFPSHGDQLVPLPISMARLNKVIEVATIASFLVVALLGLLDALNGSGPLDIVRIQSVTIAFTAYVFLRFTFGKVKKVLVALLALAFFTVAALKGLTSLDHLLIHALSGLIGGLLIPGKKTILAHASSTRQEPQ